MFVLCTLLYKHFITVAITLPPHTILNTGSHHTVPRPPSKCTPSLTTPSLAHHPSPTFPVEFITNPRASPRLAFIFMQTPPVLLVRLYEKFGILVGSGTMVGLGALVDVGVTVGVLVEVEEPWQHPRREGGNTKTLHAGHSTAPGAAIYLFPYTRLTQTCRQGGVQMNTLVGKVSSARPKDVLILSETIWYLHRT